MSAYNQVKVWEIDPETLTRTRPSHIRGPTRPTRSPSPTRMPSRETPEESRERAERNERISVWARLGVVGILSVAMLFWPYYRSCGIGLVGYLAASIMVVVGGVWVVACTWIVRMARTHIAAMVIVIWGLALITAEVLPRVGYASHAATWLCRGP